MPVTKYYEGVTNNQYEDINEGKFLFREHIEARYIKQELPQYKGNLLIEALPPIKNFEQVFDFLKRFPVYSEEERYYSNEYRIHSIFRLLDYVLPTSSNLLTDEYLSIIIRNGYVSKRIDTPQYLKTLKKANSNLFSDNIENNELITHCSISSNSATGCLIIGPSGSGKTTGVNNILSQYPQVIRHVIDYGESKGVFTQIPWIRVDCSYNGKISGVCSQFFQEIDLLLGTKYTNQYSKRGALVDRMIASISFLALKYGIGVLVVDEIQHIRHTNNGESLFNFFVTLSNTIKIPIVFIGTYKASKTILGEQYRHGRKAEGIGTIEYLRLKQKENEWDTFIEFLWNYQWLKNKTPLTQKLKDLMYKRTIGIIDRANKLFMAVQLEAIFSGEEKITEELINRVADEKFKLTGAIIKAFESGDPNEISKCEDIKAPDMNIENYLGRNKATEKINQIYNDEKFKESVNKQMIIDSIIIGLNTTMQYDKKTIEKVAIRVVSNKGFDTDIGVLIREVAKQMLVEELQTEKEIKFKQTKRSNKNGDIKKSKNLLDNFQEENKKDILDGIQ
ncbi:ATP-binding protein [Clostridium sp. 'White wine YQ']|uniref:ATP-binding protein n=1 Tax=Clostridium sp. 'White wine YQ' TaxID=3027474 RepID=UPI0023659D90|nr:ATP-binding protein [Clostridium sp. 'White wine YQ']MDD7795900.1 ATP-binding protein [Clostridium sp. 'White wine YQ']